MIIFDFFTLVSDKLDHIVKYEKLFKAGDQYKRLESKTGLCYFFLNIAKIPKIATDAIIPAVPSVSFV